ncbi:endonuclease 8-like 1 [Protobothrops mucrosquamatus]|uniref:endonuclease 8-like 1 n=1 Tax=Protobothrops mucrosquamatus TaxID=103944 RepID=UPI000775B884|nr:endonuclease 8-like 1 [Protobothrops mucrosquamatus]
MPEGPELFLASRYINAECAGITFTGKVEKSEVSKNPEVPFESDGYLISAVSRGKELKLTLTPIKREGSKEPPMDLVFRFGMCGNFKLVPISDMPKHAHLRFYTQEKPLRVLCYVDVRRFGKWEVDGTWQPNRGPCVMLEYEQFRENILRNLSDKAFDKPICEALLNQKFFNGVGNYLRAEILYQSKIPPFEKARTVLEDLQRGLQVSGATTLSKKVKLKRENPDLLEVCHLLPMEVVNLGGGKGYDLTNREHFAVFEEWLHCYSLPGMKSLRDANGRTIWFQGDPGPLAPKGGKSQKKKTQAKSKPAVQSSKASKGTKNSSSSPAQKEVKGRRKLKPEDGVIQEKEDGSVVGNRARGPKTRSQKSSSDLQESLPLSSPPPAQKRRTPAQKKQTKAPAISRSKRVKAS